MSEQATSRSTDLTADLLADMESETVVESASLGAVNAVEIAIPAADGPFLETTLFLRPRGWARPGIHGNAADVVLRLGPLRVRARR